MLSSLQRKGNSNVDETYQKILAAQEEARLVSLIGMTKF